jgi:Adenylate cyclase, class 2 (thermophilic)
MGLECELKYVDVDLDGMSRRLEAGGARPMGRYFESNLVFDRPDRSLMAAGTLLRLRSRQGEAVLTVKRPSSKDAESALKVREELETVVGDFDVMRASLEALGFSVAFAYEKVREKWKHLGCTVCLDHLPFGDYVEIEGGEETVPVCAKALELGQAVSTKASYHALNLEHRAACGLDPDESFVFSDIERAGLLDEMGKV